MVEGLKTKQEIEQYMNRILKRKHETMVSMGRKWKFVIWYNIKAEIPGTCKTIWNFRRKQIHFQNSDIPKEKEKTTDMRQRFCLAVILSFMCSVKCSNACKTMCWFGRLQLASNKFSFPYFRTTLPMDYCPFHFYLFTFGLLLWR